ncbi:insecticidal delta-endotoxin Cry8Ea1 family protein [Bacillus thuringiensis]
MKYKDRKDAKRKYKQALLATVATMTLGVSTLGSTSSAFAEEKTTGAQQEQAATDSLGAGGGAASSKPFEVLTDGTVKLLNNNIFDSKTQQAIVKLGGDGLKQTYKDLQSGNFEETARTLTLGAVALIPYGGAFVSPILGLLWPGSESDKMKELQDQIKAVDEKVNALQNANLKAKYDALMADLHQFENGMNNKSGSSSFRMAGSIEESNRTAAMHINSKFKELIQQCKIEMLKNEELPMYTLVATAHLVFLQIIEKNQSNPRLQLDQQSYNTYYKEDIQNLPGEYANYVMKTYKTTIEDYKKQMQDIAKNAPEGNYTSADEQQVLKMMQDKFNEKFKNFMHDGTASAISGQSDIMNKLQKAINDYSTLMNKKNKYYQETAGSEAFQIVATGHWVQENNKWSFIDTKNEKKTDWLQLGEKWYYLNPEKNDIKNSAGETFKPGEMVTGKFDIKGKTYFFKPDTGEMATGWAKDGDKYYYLSPADGTKNWDAKQGRDAAHGGATFNKGEMMYGWLDLEHYYYASPKDGAQNSDGVKFNKGEMWTGWLENPVKPGEWYYMRKEAKANQPIGSMMHDETTPDGYKIDQDGKKK